MQRRWIATWPWNRSQASPPRSGSWVSRKDVEGQPITWMKWPWVSRAGGLTCWHLALEFVLVMPPI